METISVDSRDQLLQRTQRRHRATVACNSCRARRTKCVFDPGEAECTYCRQNSFMCVINKDDKRKRQLSRTCIDSLQRRIQVLEKSLSKASAGQSPSNSPADDEITSPTLHATDPSNNEIRYPDDSEYLSVEHFTTEHDPPPPQPDAPSLIPPSLGSRRRDSDSTARNLGQASPLQVLPDQDFPKSEDVLWEIRTRAEFLLQMIPTECQEYLMELYWKKYHSILHIVHKEAFYQGATDESSGSYNGFLHLCLLAMGFTFADKSRPDMQKFLGFARAGESTLHLGSRKLAKYEMESPGGLPSIQALLILADLESGVGRDDTGWMYVGIAIRSAFHLGLNADSTEAVSERHRGERRMVFCACFLFDRFWAVYLGRSPTIKQCDIGYAKLIPIFDTETSCSDQKSRREIQVYEGLIQLMAICGEISILLSSSQDLAEVDMLKMAVLEKQLRAWRAELPPTLRWMPENLRLAPPSFFLLHQQYHMAVILLHQPLVHREDFKHPRQVGTADPSLNDETFLQLSGNVCYKHASVIGHIFEHYYQTPSKMQPFGTALLTASTAGIALVNDLTTVQQNVYEGHRSLRQTQVLLNVLASMGHKYRRANQIAKSLGNVLIDRGWAFSSATSFSANNIHPLTVPRPLSGSGVNSQAPIVRNQAEKVNIASRARSRFGSPYAEARLGFGQLQQDQQYSNSGNFQSDNRLSFDDGIASTLCDLSPGMNDWLNTETMSFDAGIFETAIENMF